MAAGGGGVGVSKLGDEIIQGLREAVAHARGGTTGARVTEVQAPDVRADKPAVLDQPSEAGTVWRSAGPEFS